MRPIRSLSVLMPTYQGMEFLERVLAALAGQRLDLPWDFLAVDSSSTDGTRECLERHAAHFPVPLRVRRIEKVEFDHGDTRNLLAVLSSGDLLVYLTQDAIPADEHFLARLAANFADPRVAAAYARNVPRPDAQRLTKIFSAGDPSYVEGRREARIEDRAAYERSSIHEKRLLWNFNDVASAVRREVWERHPFPRTWFGEDVLMARALLEAGHTVVYDDLARVEHSHDYDAAETRSRTAIDGRFNAEWLDRTCVASLSDARTLEQRTLAADERALRAEGLAGAELEAELARARELRRATFEGLYEGGRAAARHPRTRVLERSSLSILFVVHGFPPDTWAGTEIYTFNLARELLRMGHRVAILAREDAAEGRADFSLRETEFQGLRVLRLTHRLAHERLSDSYRQPEIESVFHRVLVAECPDVVHFQHLVHLSVGLVEIARQAGIATVLHLHDYWALCARVQLIRPGGEICAQNRGLGCLACVKEKGEGKLSLLERIGHAGGEASVRAFAREAEARGGPGAHRWREVGDLLDRQPTVLAAFAAADLRISPSRFLREKLLASGAFDAHTTIYSDNGMRTDHVRALTKRPSLDRRVRLGFVGSLVWYKGGEVLVRAMRILRGAPIELTFHGAFDPARDPHHAELARLAEGCAVRFAGRFDNSRLSEVYEGIDVLVVPSVWYENSPITIHEAWLTRTPVVASGIGGMAEFVRDGIDGLHFRVGDAEDLAAKLRRFVDEPGLLAELSREFPAAKSIEENARESEFRYRALVARERAPRTAARGPLLELAGRDAALREGPVEEQGADMLLLRPAGAVEYDLYGAGSGDRVLTVEVFALENEPDLELSGRVLVDGVLVDALPRVRPRGRDEVFAVDVPIALRAGARRLRLESTTADGGSAHLRVKRVLVRERETEA